MVDLSRLSVLIGADSLTAKRSGIGRITLEIARAARSCGEIDQVRLLMPQGVSQRVAPIELIDHLDEAPVPAPEPVPIPWKVALGRVPGVQSLRRVKHGGLSRIIRRAARESGGRLVYHEPNMIVQQIALPTVSTINDLSWHHEPSWHPAERLRWIDQNLHRTLCQARRFVAVSQFTKDAAVRDLGIAADRIDVVWNAPAAEFQPVTAAAAAAVLARHGLRDRGYVLSVSTIEPRKNFDRLLSAHLRLPPGVRSRFPLVIVGDKGWGEVLHRPEAAGAVRDGSMLLLGHVPDADLVPLCSRAAVFAYVSLYEGFGLPVIEAMATATPVLASSTTAVGEVAADAALLVDPLDVVGISDGMVRLIEDTTLADRLRHVGVARAAQFTWASAVQGLLVCWRKTLA